MMHSDVPEDLAARLREIGPGFELAATRALYEPLWAAQSHEGVRLHADVRYGNDPRHCLDIYAPTMPAHVPSDKNGWPVLVNFHGGGFIRGDKSQCANIGWHFAQQGVLTIVPNYRLAPDAQWPSGSQDVVAVWRWLQDHVRSYGGDPRRIVLMGESAGATHVAAAVLMCEFQPSDWAIAGAALVSGPYNARLEGLARSQFGVDTPDPRNEAYFGADLSQWDGASIVDHISAEPFPIFISMAELDLLQMQVQAGELFARLVSRHRFAPQFRMIRAHNHFSQGMSIGTGDESLAQPLLQFLNAVVRLEISPEISHEESHEHNASR